MAIGRTELHTRFTYHKPSRGQSQTYSLIRSETGDLAQLIIDNTPASREQSLALTKLEEAMFWANAAIARRETQKSTQGRKPYAEIPPEYDSQPMVCEKHPHLGWPHDDCPGPGISPADADADAECQPDTWRDTVAD